MARISSRKYLDGAKGETCKLRIAGVVCSGPETVVSCHVRDRHTGKALKASDISVADGCFNCHEVFDRRAKLPSGEYLTEEEWLFYALRGIQETQEARHERGLLIVPEDAVKAFHERRTAPRLPPEQRKKIQSANRWPEAPRPLRSRNNLKRQKETTP